MASFYYDVKKLKRVWSEESLKEWGDYVAECFRSDEFYKDGWADATLEDFSIEGCTLNIRWGMDEEGYKQEFNETIEYNFDEWFEEFDKHFPERKPKPVGIKFHYMDDEPEEEYSVFGTKI